MIDTHRMRSLALDRDEALLFALFEIDKTPNLGSGLSSGLLGTLLGLPWKLPYVEVSEFYSHLRLTVGLSLSPCTTEQSAIEVMQVVSTSIESACKPSKITATQAVLVPSPVDV